MLKITFYKISLPNEYIGFLENFTQTVFTLSSVDGLGFKIFASHHQKKEQGHGFVYFTR